MADTLNYNPHRASRVPAGDNSLTQLIRRLEAATSRLEDIATSATSLEPHHSNGISNAPNGIRTTGSAPELSTLSDSVTAGQSSNATHSAAPSLPVKVSDMDLLVEQDVNKFVGASKELDGTISEQVRATYVSLRAMTVLLTPYRQAQ